MRVASILQCECPYILPKEHIFRLKDDSACCLIKGQVQFESDWLSGSHCILPQISHYSCVRRAEKEWGRQGSALKLSLNSFSNFHMKFYLQKGRCYIIIRTHKSSLGKLASTEQLTYLYWITGGFGQRMCLLPSVHCV